MIMRFVILMNQLWLSIIVAPRWVNENENNRIIELCRVKKEPSFYLELSELIQTNRGNKNRYRENIANPCEWTLIACRPRYVLLSVNLEMNTFPFHSESEKNMCGARGKLIENERNEGIIQPTCWHVRRQRWMGGREKWER